jgi:multisubunit Na+/H+ antiporter MnhG subunit
MELDDLKNTWNEMGERVVKTQKISLKIIDKMNANSFHSRLRKIAIPEILGSIICVASAIYIIVNFNKLNTLFYQVAGILCILMLVISPALSLASIRALYKAIDTNKTYADALKSFTESRITFCKLQKMNLRLSYFFLVTLILLCTKLFGTNPTTHSKYFFIFAYTFGFCFLLVFSKWVFSSYNKTIKDTEALLKELSS